MAFSYLEFGNGERYIAIGDGEGTKMVTRGSRAEVQESKKVYEVWNIFSRCPSVFLLV